MSVMVWIEQNNNGPVGNSFEVLGKAKELAAALGTQTVAVLVGGDTANVEQVRSYGADVVMTVTSPSLASYRLSAYVKALRKAVEAAGATVILMAATVRGREVAAMLGSELEAGYAPDAIDLRVEGGKLVAVRSVYSNNILADVTFNSPVQVVSVRPRSFPMPEPGAASGEVKAVDAGLSEGDIKEQVIEVKSTDTGEVSLTDASIIVSGGRGVQQDPAKGFELVAQLANVLGAAVGASRAAVDAGYIPYKHQVGQTGKTVKPDLYIAAGISGAIQHLAGMGGSKIIVAINKDAEAPIFEKANYGIVGDLYQVLPALTAEFKKRLGK
ncbi:MAG TPA: electron transfer flavoprotein subunit alpha [Chloroflexi bacterium]|nr:electron transfer flavoprotein subunit alpha [Chloroflexota bacterium]HHW88669.1 electron transfer flavoprotein subunit alpha/FixB family protein [Chloroflexota bacterium]